MKKKRPTAMTLPDVLAMTTSGQPAPGKRVRLPSGAVWEGGSGTATITLPDEDPIMLGADGRIPPNRLIGSGIFGLMDSVLADVLGTQPGAIAERVAGQALDLLRPDGDAADSKTRLIKFTSKTTLFNPAKPPSDNAAVEADVPGYAHGGTVIGPGTGTSDSILARLSKGEFVVNAASTANALPLLEAINAGWVPSPGYLAGMLPGFAAGGLVGDSAVNDPERWRSLLGTGLAADVIGGVAGAALDAAGAAGAALGGALAPVFRGGGAYSRRTNDPMKVDLGQQGAAFAENGPALSAQLQVEPQGVMNVAPAFADPSTASADGSVAPLMALSEALTAGIMSSATEAGGRVGLALGNAIAPALGPAGDMAPVIGESLGQALGSRFGGGLTAAMSLKTEIGPTGTPTFTEGGAGGAVAPGGASPAGATTWDGVGGGTTITGGGSTTTTGGGGSSVIVSGGDSAGGGAWVWYPEATKTETGPATTPRTPALNGKSLVDEKYWTTYSGADSIDRGAVVGSSMANKLAESFGLSGNPAVSDFGADLGALAGALNIPQITSALGVDSPLLAQLGIDPEGSYFVPGEQQKQFKMNEADNLTAGIQGFLSGTSSGGLVKGITGAAKGVAETAAGQLGSFIGAGIGTAIAGPAGAAVGGVLGSLVGSIGAGKAVDLVAKPIEWVASTAKELVGTGFGLTDLAEGVGGHTARGDIFNFNGMDPKSVAMSIARVQRRQSFAQQRGGGLGR
ncbi:hypothetical protein [Nocardia asteroides]|uniref:hypothetical protein n=1 Tax=Nocardia asteroides TaxID=1824 RepID=UPI0002F4D8CF|nr:hypothetical protein [Nocardia asteroides]